MLILKSYSSSIRSSNLVASSVLVFGKLDNSKKWDIQLENDKFTAIFKGSGSKPGHWLSRG